MAGEVPRGTNKIGICERVQVTANDGHLLQFFSSGSNCFGSFGELFELGYGLTLNGFGIALRDVFHSTNRS
jgi:hypothetical protein